MGKSNGETVQLEIYGMLSVAPAIISVTMALELVMNFD